MEKDADHETTAGPIETEEDKKQRQEQANKQIWKKVDVETIILKTTYRRTNGKTERQQLHTIDIDVGQEEKIKRDHQIIQNDIEFADDTRLCVEKDTQEQMCERIGNYDIVTETRHRAIQWKKSRTATTRKTQAGRKSTPAL